MDCLKIARANPDKKVVFFAIGFETTAPANAMSVWQARQQGLRNYSILVSHVLVPPAMEAILQSPENRVQAFLGPGHVCTVVGYHEYEPIAAKYHVPIVVTGFEPLDLMQGTLMALRQLESGRAEVENQYPRVVKREGNLVAQELVNNVFEVCDRGWRGVGTIPQSGYRLRAEFRDYDAEQLFEVTGIQTQESPSASAAGPARDQEAARLPRLRQGMHAAASARGDDGLGGRRLRRLLHLRTPLAKAEAGAREKE